MITVYVFSQKVRAKAATTQAKQGKTPLVEFGYPSSKSPVGAFTHRSVRLIGANKQHLIGLEILPGEKKPRYQFKRFRRDRMVGLSLTEFNPTAV